MVLYGLPTKLVLLIILSICIYVQPLQTGYIYKNEHVEQDELYKDLKCGYLYGGFTQMRLIKVLLENRTERRDIVIAASKLNTVVRSQLISLHCIEGMRIGAMWLLLLFTSLQIDVYRESPDPREDRAKIMDTLSYVIEKLEDDLSGCGKGNSFDSYERIMKSGRWIGFTFYTNTILREFVERAMAQLEANKIVDNLLNKRLDLSIVKYNSLLIRHFGTDDKLKYDLQNVFNLKMTWNDTTSVLKTAWLNARALDWKTTNLRHIRTYYNRCFEFLIIIIYRLTSKHMEYLRFHVGTPDLYVFYAREWYNIVIRFGNILNLSEDINVRNLFTILENLINKIESIDSVVRYIAAKLIVLCEPFECEASYPLVIDEQEFQITPVSVTEKEINYLLVTFDPVAINLNSLANAKMFLTYLLCGSIFFFVDFGLIRALTTYIDELNPKKCPEGLDECAEELEHLVINILD